MGEHLGAGGLGRVGHGLDLLRAGHPEEEGPGEVDRDRRDWRRDHEEERLCENEKTC